MTTTKRDLQALHYLAQRLRADTHGAGPWHDNGLAAVLAKLEGHNLAITVERVTRHAADPEARTPAAIERPFVPDVQKPPTPRPPKPAECCKRCGRDLHGPDVACEAPTKRPAEKTTYVTPEVERLRALLSDDVHQPTTEQGADQ
jgi:hypothetical protein